MRFIPKLPEPACMLEFKKLQHDNGLAARYASFRDKKLLNDILRTETKGLCCYCQSRIDHYQGEKLYGAHNEHLEPQSHDSGDGAIDLDYGNIYACCILSKGQPKRLQHCGEAKGEEEISKIIQWPECEDLFAYNLNGEIIPKGEYYSWQEYIDNHTTLPSVQKELTDAIKTLKLNIHSLVANRKQTLDDTLKWASTVDRQTVENKLRLWEEGDNLPQFYSMIKFFLSKLRR